MSCFKRTGLPAYALAAVLLLGFAAWPPAADSKGLGCVPVTEEAIANLFTDWNNALQTGNPDKVVDLYASDGILPPTVENGPLIGNASIRGYFETFSQKQASRKN